MDKWIWMIVIAALIISIAGSVFIVVYVMKKQRKQDMEKGIGRPKPGGFKGKSSQGKKWNRIMTSYIFLCILFIVIILYQSMQGMEERASDSLGVLAGAFFFIIMAFSCKNKAIRQELATAYTTAAFIGLERLSTGESGSVSYNSILEYTVQEVTHRTRYKGKLDKEKGAQVELYYAPDDPDLVYVPEMEKSKSRLFPALILFYGVLFPIVSLVAPLLR